MFDYAGCIHFHSEYSYDARTPLTDILRAALNTGLHFAVLTDHFRMDARSEGWEGYHPMPGRTDGLGTRGGRKVLLLVGEEISPRYNHYLALGLRQPVVVWKSHLNAQNTIDAVNAQGGFGFIAHPGHEGAMLAGARAFPWIAWDVRGFAGMGIWDLMSDWTAALNTRLGGWLAYLFPERALRGPRAETLAHWDEWSQQAHCVAIGEVDNHAQVRRFFGLKRRIFPFEFAFRTIRTHVLLKQPLTQDADADQAAILSALRQGASYISCDLWQDPTGFRFTMIDQDRQAEMGDEITWKGPTLLEVKLPGPGRIRILRNGRVVWEERSRAQLQRDVDMPGVYRVEAYQEASGRRRPWIFSNPIWVLQKKVAST